MTYLSFTHKGSILGHKSTLRKFDTRKFPALITQPWYAPQKKSTIVDFDGIELYQLTHFILFIH